VNPDGLDWNGKPYYNTKRAERNVYIAYLRLTGGWSIKRLAKEFSLSDSRIRQLIARQEKRARERATEWA
jgi:Mor family transcriptional regulator